MRPGFVQLLCVEWIEIAFSDPHVRRRRDSCSGLFGNGRAVSLRVSRETTTASTGLEHYSSHTLGERYLSGLMTVRAAARRFSAWS